MLSDTSVRPKKLRSPSREEGNHRQRRRAGQDLKFGSCGQVTAPSERPTRSELRLWSCNWFAVTPERAVTTPGRLRSVKRFQYIQNSGPSGHLRTDENSSVFSQLIAASTVLP